MNNVQYATDPIYTTIQNELTFQDYLHSAPSHEGCSYDAPCPACCADYIAFKTDMASMAQSDQIPDCNVTNCTVCSSVTPIPLFSSWYDSYAPTASTMEALSKTFDFAAKKLEVSHV